MNVQADKVQEPQNSISQRFAYESSNGGISKLIDNRPFATCQRKLQEGMHASTDQIQRKANKTGLPDNLKTGIENLSGYSMDDVKVHYNSSKPAQLQAYAYAQGTDIHLASGQEKHLPHEAWHVVQQKQGRVKPTMQLKGKVNINDDTGLEKEADVMGMKAIQRISQNPNKHNHYYHKNSLAQTIQRQKVVDPNRLNVVGEKHGELLESNEEKFAKEKFKALYNPYWKEFNLYSSNTVGKIEGGESILIRFVWEFKKELAKTNKTLKKPREILNNLLVFEGNYFFIDNLKKVIKYNANEEAELAEELLGIIMDASKEPDNNDINTLLSSNEYRLYEDYSKLESKIINYWKNHTYFFNPEFGELLNIENKSFNKASKNLMKARSVIMLNHANRHFHLKGIWKIGQDHVTDIRRWYSDDELNFNLIDRDDWLAEFLPWEKYMVDKRGLEKLSNANQTA